VGGARAGARLRRHRRRHGRAVAVREKPDVGTDDEFRLLWATSRATGARIATFANYSPHATVLNTSNTEASGDWPEWAAEIAEGRFGGTGIAGVGRLGREDFGEDDSQGLEHAVATRSPWMHGGVVGAYAGAARVGDVFIGFSPGEPFPQLQWYLREDGGVTGARTHFHLGATNDFLGYMVRPLDHYPQTAVEGVGYLLGCPEEEVLARAGVPFDDACTDHWTLMVSPTIGSHVVCTIQDAALRLGFSSRQRDPACAGLTRADGVSAPAEANAG